MHNDEAGVGRAVKESGISREKIWITSKLWPTEYGEVFEKIMIESRVKPAVLQIECHSYAQRLAIRDKVKPYGIHITCWFLLGGAMSNGALFSLSSDK